MDGMYVRTAGGWYVAWSLEVPSQWSEWTLVEVLRAPGPTRRMRACLRLQIVPRRALLPEEALALRARPLLFWGMKVEGAPWALVMCKVAQSSATASLSSYSGRYDPTRSIGV